MQDYKRLPRVALDELELVHETGCYDGPIEGLVRLHLAPQARRVKV
jgi:hypothetical protein